MIKSKYSMPWIGCALAMLTLINYNQTFLEVLGKNLSIGCKDCWKFSLRNPYLKKGIVKIFRQANNWLTLMDSGSFLITVLQMHTLLKHSFLASVWHYCIYDIFSIQYLHDWVWTDAGHGKDVANCEQQLNPPFFRFLKNILVNFKIFIIIYEKNRP